MTPIRPKLIVFDLNRTLIEENSWRDLNLAMGVTPEEDKMLLSWGQQGIVTDQEAQRILCRIYQTRGEPTRAAIEQVIFGYTYRTGARETVDELRNRGYEITLLSGSIDILVEHVASELHIKHFGANNSFVFDESGNLTDIQTISKDTDYKVTQLRDICSTLEIAPTDCLAVGDGDNDAELFSACGTSITFIDSPIAHLATHSIQKLRDILEVVQ